MLQNLASAIKLRATIVFILVHLGLISSLWGLAKLTLTEGWSPTAIFLTLGMALLYGGFALAIFLIMAPIWPWVQRARRLRDLTAWILNDLPKLLEQLPKIVAAVRTARAAWDGAGASDDAPKS